MIAKQNKAENKKGGNACRFPPSLCVPGMA
jgi:hypothetical protein